MSEEANLTDDGSNVPLHFAEFTLDESQRQLFRGAEAVRISPRAFQLLTVLVHERPRALSKTDLHETLWPNTFVSDTSLATLVAELRSALGDDRSQSRYIRTLHGFGYAFTAKVTEDATPAVRTEGQRFYWGSARLVISAIFAAVVCGRSVVTNAAAVDVQSDEAYARAKDLMRRAPDEPESLSRALIAFKEVARRQPNSARAYVGIANCYQQMGLNSILLPTEASSAARDALDKASQLDPNSADVYVALGDVEAMFEWKTIAAEQNYRRALSLAPNNVRAHYRYAILLAFTGQFDEAIEQAKRACELDPVATETQNVLAWVLYVARRYDDAIAEYRKLVVQHPENAMAQEDLGNVYAAAGRNAETFAAYQQWARLAGYPAEVIDDLDRAWRVGGLEGYWRKRIELEQQETADTGDVFPYTMAMLYARLGDTDNALSWLQRAYEQRNPHLTRLLIDPSFERIRNDARFQRMMRRVADEGR